uniref:Gag-pol polyprotein n=1 Tax=Solanum tuberosum TaxID=4113 RepID=M1DFU2_SOLTU
MVADMRSRMSLFVVGLTRLSSKESKAAMLIGYIGIGRLMIHVQQVEKDQLKDREEFENKRAKTSGNEFGQQESNVNQFSFQHKQKGPAPSSASAPAPRNKCSKAQGGTKTPTRTKYGRSHSGVVPTHFEKDKKELAKEVHRLVRLGVRLMDPTQGGVVVMNRSESSLVSEVKEQQDKDPLLLELKAKVHKQKGIGF